MVGKYKLGSSLSRFPTSLRRKVGSLNTRLAQERLEASTRHATSRWSRGAAQIPYVVYGGVLTWGSRRVSFACRASSLTTRMYQINEFVGFMNKKGTLGVV